MQHHRHQDYPFPTGNADLDRLERLKMEILEGQNPYYKAVPQPNFLENLYLGRRSHSQVIVPPHPDQIPSRVNTGSPAQRPTQAPGHPPNVQSKSEISQPSRVGHSDADSSSKPPESQTNIYLPTFNNRFRLQADPNLIMSETRSHDPLIRGSEKNDLNKGVVEPGITKDVRVGNEEKYTNGSAFGQKPPPANGRDGDSTPGLDSRYNRRLPGFLADYGHERHSGDRYADPQWNRDHVRDYRDRDRDLGSDRSLDYRDDDRRPNDSKAPESQPSLESKHDSSRLATDLLNNSQLPQNTNGHLVPPDRLEEHISHSLTHTEPTSVSPVADSNSAPTNIDTTPPGLSDTSRLEQLNPNHSDIPSTLGKADVPPVVPQVEGQNEVLVTLESRLTPRASLEQRIGDRVLASEKKSDGQIQSSHTTPLVDSPVAVQEQLAARPSLEDRISTENDVAPHSAAPAVIIKEEPQTRSLLEGRIRPEENFETNVHSGSFAAPRPSNSRSENWVTRPTAEKQMRHFSDETRDVASYPPNTRASTFDGPPNLSGPVNRHPTNGEFRPNRNQRGRGLSTRRPPSPVYRHDQRGRHHEDRHNPNVMIPPPFYHERESYPEHPGPVEGVDSHPPARHWGDREFYPPRPFTDTDGPRQFSPRPESRNWAPPYENRNYRGGQFRTNEHEHPGGWEPPYHDSHEPIPPPPGVPRSWDRDDGVSRPPNRRPYSYGQVSEPGSRDFERARYPPEVNIPRHERIRGRSPSPPRGAQGAMDDMRPPPMKRQREAQPPYFEPGYTRPEAIDYEPSPSFNPSTHYDPRDATFPARPPPQFIPRDALPPGDGYYDRRPVMAPNRR